MCGSRVKNFENIVHNNELSENHNDKISKGCQKEG